jgi:hypothetical protein
MKLTLTPLFTHLFSVWFLNRHFVFGTIWYFLLSLFGLFMYEFTVWDKNNKSVSFDHYASFLGGFKFIIPKIYSINFSTLFTSDTPNFFQWLPHILMGLSSLCNGLIPVLSKSFLVKAAHEAKNLQYQRQKTKLKDGQLNVQFLDQDMLLKPKIVTKTSMVYKRYQHLYDNKKKVARAVQTTKMHKPFKEGYLHS